MLYVVLTSWPCQCYFITASEPSCLLTLWRPLGFGDFRKKTPKRTWLSAGHSPVWYALQTR